MAYQSLLGYLMLMFFLFLFFFFFCKSFQITNVNNYLETSVSFKSMFLIEATTAKTDEDTSPSTFVNNNNKTNDLYLTSFQDSA